jgi:TetR/AcrR family transcriptional repressor of nem operon
MGRPAQFNRDAAIDAVMQKIWRHGYEACSVKTLSERLGITRSSFYNAFGSRAELFGEVLDRYFLMTPDLAFAEARKGERIKPLVSRTFREICRSRANDKEGKGCLAVNSVSELCNVDEALGPMLAEAILGSLTRIETLLNWAVEQRELPASTNTHGLALAVQSLLIGINTMSKVVRDEAELWLATRTTLEGLGLYATSVAASPRPKRPNRPGAAIADPG